MARSLEASSSVTLLAYLTCAFAFVGFVAPSIVLAFTSQAQPLHLIDWPVHWLRSSYGWVSFVFHVVVAIMVTFVFALKPPCRKTANVIAVMLVLLNVVMFVLTGFAINEWRVGPGIPEETLASKYNTVYCHAFASHVCTKEQSADAVLQFLGSSMQQRGEDWLPMVGTDEDSAAACWGQVNDTAVSLWRTCQQAAKEQTRFGPLNWFAEKVVNTTAATTRRWCHAFLAQEWGVFPSDGAFNSRAWRQTSPYAFDQHVVAAYMKSWWFDVFFYFVFTLLTMVGTFGLAFVCWHAQQDTNDDAVHADYHDDATLAAKKHAQEVC